MTRSGPIQIEQPKITTPKGLVHFAQPLASQGARAENKDPRIRLFGQQLMRNGSGLDGLSKPDLIGQHVPPDRVVDNSANDKSLVW